MTDPIQPVPEDSPLLRKTVHDDGLHTVRATVVGTEQPTPGFFRFTARLDEAAADPRWADPNVTIRLELGPDYGNASRVYTVRRFEPATATIAVDVALHGSQSPMMRWAARVQHGDELRFRGPRQHLRIPETPGHPVALFADTTALPALASLLDQWPAGASGIGWVETADAEAFAAVDTIPTLVLHRIDPAAETGGLLARVRTLADLKAYTLWAAGERDEMRALRSHARAAGLGPDRLAITAYWKRGVSNTELDHHRLEQWARILKEGGGLADFDDLA